MGRRLFPDPRWEDRVPRWQHPLWAVDFLQLPQFLTTCRHLPVPRTSPFFHTAPCFCLHQILRGGEEARSCSCSVLPTCVRGGRTGFPSGLIHQPCPMPSSYWCTEHLLCSAPALKTLDIPIFNIFTLLYFWEGPMAAVSSLQVLEVTMSS